MGTATLEFVLKQGRATSWTIGVSSLSATEQFAQAIQPYTNAAIGRVGFTVSSDLTNSERDDAFADMNIYGALFFKNETGNLVKFFWPAPRADLFTTVGSRHVLNTEIGEAVGEALSEATGHTLTFRHGGITTR